MCAECFPTQHAHLRLDRSAALDHNDFVQDEKHCSIFFLSLAMLYFRVLICVLLPYVAEAMTCLDAVLAEGPVEHPEVVVSEKSPAKRWSRKLQAARSSSQPVRGES